MLANLLDNATRHSPPGGVVTVSAVRCGTVLRLVVTDGGSGLGLAIARWVVDLHGGTIRADAAVPPPGCAVVVELPDGRQPRAPMTPEPR